MLFWAQNANQGWPTSIHGGVCFPACLACHVPESVSRVSALPLCHVFESLLSCVCLSQVPVPESPCILMCVCPVCLSLSVRASLCLSVLMGLSLSPCVSMCVSLSLCPCILCHSLSLSFISRCVPWSLPLSPFSVGPVTPFPAAPASSLLGPSPSGAAASSPAPESALGCCVWSGVC